MPSTEQVRKKKEKEPRSFGRKVPHFTVAGTTEPGWQLDQIPVCSLHREELRQLSTDCGLSSWQSIPGVRCRLSWAAGYDGFTLTQPNAKLQIREQSAGHATERAICTLESRGCEKDKKITIK